MDGDAKEPHTPPPPLTADDVPASPTCSIFSSVTEDDATQYVYDTVMEEQFKIRWDSQVPRLEQTMAELAGSPIPVVEALQQPLPPDIAAKLATATATPMFPPVMKLPNPAEKSGV